MLNMKLLKRSPMHLSKPKQQPKLLLKPLSKSKKTRRFPNSKSLFLRNPSLLPSLRPWKKRKNLTNSSQLLRLLRAAPSKETQRKLWMMFLLSKPKNLKDKRLQSCCLLIIHLKT
mmetsp:Transcript_19614/g.30224  ORF Transcript_19614/g.30224 Transcript_19614/m.30224 type:complete len:115 (+) Transcript_19614:4068-4412(+)